MWSMHRFLIGGLSKCEFDGLEGLLVDKMTGKINQ